MDTANKLRQARQAVAISQSELARRAGISRQALSAIESGAYQPGVSVALRLAKELGTTVENLFDESDQTEHLVAETPSRSGCVPQARVMLARVGGRLIALPVPATCVTLSPANGMVARKLRGKRVAVEAFRSSIEIDATLVIAGCDPGMTILRDYLARHQPFAEVAAVPAASEAALYAVAKGEAHAAGVHLRDPHTGDYNVVAAHEAFGNRPFHIVNFARWELGLATRKDGPPVTSVADLAQPGIRMINRPLGSGARAVLDEMLASKGLRTTDIQGYRNAAPGHLEVAAALASGSADAGVTIRLAADLYGLNFMPWRDERYDLVIAAQNFHLAAVQRLIDVLNSRALAREIAQLCAYDTSRMGTIVEPVQAQT